MSFAFVLSGISCGNVKKSKIPGKFSILNPSVWVFSAIAETQMTEWARQQIFCALDVKNKKSLKPNLYLIECFPKFLLQLDFSSISELRTNTFNIPFRINLKNIIIGTSSHFHDGAQLKFYPQVAQRYYTLLDWVQETFLKTWSSFLLF